jgi:alpha-ketoglutarate-dependent taurine dioxygenase
MTTTQVGTKLGIRKITARIGAEITGLSPDLILDPETIAAVRTALNEHKALVFRGIRLDDEAQQRFAGADFRAPHRARRRRRAERPAG